VIHVLGLEFDEEHNGEIRFQIYLFLKKLQAFTRSMLTMLSAMFVIWNNGSWQPVMKFHLTFLSGL
jgi:hypothetical protein